MVYEQIIIGAGAAGLYCGASIRKTNGLILESTEKIGQKLLMSGNGQCNLTHGGSIKNFISHYGSHGPLIRTALYRHSNQAVMDFFQSQGLQLQQRLDGKVFPKSRKALDVLTVLQERCRSNGYEIKTGQPVFSIKRLNNDHFLVNDRYTTGKLIIATGGCSHPATGSDGSMFAVLERIGLTVTERLPALTPIFVQQYPFGELTGISLKDVQLSIINHKVTDDLLFTHNGFSGPAILNLSRYASAGDTLKINYCPEAEMNFQLDGNNKQAGVYFSDQLRLPRRLVDILLLRAGIESSRKVSTLSGKEVGSAKGIFVNDIFSISGLGGFNTAMVTRGGVSIDQVCLKTFETKRFPGLFIIGEALDIDGDTGGYNLQFAFSSGYCAAYI